MHWYVLYACCFVFSFFLFCEMHIGVHYMCGLFAFICFNFFVSGTVLSAPPPPHPFFFFLRASIYVTCFCSHFIFCGNFHFFHNCFSGFDFCLTFTGIFVPCAIFIYSRISASNRVCVCYNMCPQTVNTI